MGNVNMEASQINYRGGEKKMSVEEALKNTSGEAAAIAQLQEDVANLNGSKANRVDIATEFSDLTNYYAGDLVYYEGDLYEFQVDHTAGSWETSEVIQKDLSDIVNTLKSGLAYTNYGAISTSSNFSAILCKVSNIALLKVSEFVSLPAGETILQEKIPAGYRPKFDIVFTLVQRNASHRVLAFDVKTNGNINLYNYGAEISSATAFGDMLSWPIAS